MTEEKLTCVLKRLISGSIAGLAALTAAVMTLPQNTTLDGIPLSAILSSIVAFLSGLYSPNERIPTTPPQTSQISENSQTTK